MQEQKKLMPLWDYAIMVLPKDAEKKIIRPDNFDMTKVGTLELEVVSIGPDCNNLKVGDRMVFNPAASVHFGYEGQQYFLISERACAAIVGPPRILEESLAAPALPA